MKRIEQYLSEAVRRGNNRPSIQKPASRKRSDVEKWVDLMGVPNRRPEQGLPAWNQSDDNPDEKIKSMFVYPLSGQTTGPASNRKKGKYYKMWFADGILEDITECFGSSYITYKLDEEPEKVIDYVYRQILTECRPDLLVSGELDESVAHGKRHKSQRMVSIGDHEDDVFETISIRSGKKTRYVPYNDNVWKGIVRVLTKEGGRFNPNVWKDMDGVYLQWYPQIGTEKKNHLTVFFRDLVITMIFDRINGDLLDAWLATASESEEIAEGEDALSIFNEWLCKGPVSESVVSGKNRDIPRYGPRYTDSVEDIAEWVEKLGATGVPFATYSMHDLSPSEGKLSYVVGPCRRPIEKWVILANRFGQRVCLKPAGSQDHSYIYHNHKEYNRPFDICAEFALEMLADPRKPVDVTKYEIV